MLGPRPTPLPQHPHANARNSLERMAIFRERTTATARDFGVLQVAELVTSQTTWPLRRHVTLAGQGETGGLCSLRQSL